MWRRTCLTHTTARPPGDTAALPNCQYARYSRYAQHASESGLPCSFPTPDSSTKLPHNFKPKPNPRHPALEITLINSNLQVFTKQPNKRRLLFVCLTRGNVFVCLVRNCQTLDDAGRVSCVDEGPVNGTQHLQVRNEMQAPGTHQYGGCPSNQPMMNWGISNCLAGTMLSNI